MKHRVIVLRVMHMLAGRTVPFDRIYFFEKKAEHIIPRAFDHAMVIHPNKPFISILKSVANSVYHPVPGKAYPMKRSDERALLQEACSTDMIDHVVRNYKDYVIVIPILMTKSGPTDDVYRSTPFKSIEPAYLHARLKIHGKVAKQSHKRNAIAVNLDAMKRNLRRMSQNTFTANSYFLARGKVFKPICAACSDSLKMLAGECFIGHENCYNGLMQQDKATIKNNIFAYKQWMSGFNEPEIQNEQLR